MSLQRRGATPGETVTGAALLYGTAVVLLASARLENTAAALAWAAGWIAAGLLPLPGGRPARLAFDTAAAAGVFLAALLGPLEPPRTPEQVLGALELVAAYLSGHGAELPRFLAPAAVSGLCAAAAVALTGVPRWKHRRAVRHRPHAGFPVRPGALESVHSRHGGRPVPAGRRRLLRTGAQRRTITGGRPGAPLPVPAGGCPDSDCRRSRRGAPHEPGLPPGGTEPMGSGAGADAGGFPE